MKAAGRVAQEANAFGKGNQLGQSPDLQFLHHHVAMGLDRSRTVKRNTLVVALLLLPRTTSSKTCRSCEVNAD